MLQPSQRHRPSGPIVSETRQAAPGERFTAAEPETPAPSLAAQHLVAVQAQAAAFPDRVLTRGIVNPAALRRFCGTLAGSLASLAQADQEGRLAALADAIATLPDRLGEKMQPDRHGKPKAPWEATLALRDLTADLRKQARRAARRESDPLAKGALEQIEALFLGIKRMATTQTPTPMIADLAATSVAQFKRQSDDGETIRPGQALGATTTWDARVGVGLTGPAAKVIGPAARIGAGVGYFEQAKRNEGGDSWFVAGRDRHLLGLASFTAAANSVTASAEATLGRREGDFAKERDFETGAAVAALQLVRRESRGLLGRVYSKSAGPLARSVSRLVRASDKGFLFKVLGQHTPTASRIPAWATEEKLAKGISALPVQRAATALGACLGGGQSEALGDLARRFFPGEAEVQATLARHLDDPEAIHRLKSRNADPVTATLVAAGDERLRYKRPYRETRKVGQIAGGLGIGPISTVGAEGTLTSAETEIRMRRGNLSQAGAVNVAETLDPAVGLGALGSLWRQYGAAPDRPPHPMLQLAETMVGETPAPGKRREVEPGGRLRSLLGDPARLAPRHARDLQALEQGLDPGALADRAKADLRRLTRHYQRFALDADQVSSGDPALVRPALARINRAVFAGALPSPEGGAAVRDFLGNAYGAYGLALAAIDGRLSLAKAAMTGARPRPSWAKTAAGADRAYAVARELMDEPNLPVLIETLRRHEPLTAPAGLEESVIRAEAEVDANALDVPHFLSGLGGIWNTLSILLPVLPVPARFMAKLEGERRTTTRHFNPLQTGTFDTVSGELVGPPLLAPLLRLGQRVQERSGQLPGMGKQGLGILKSDMKRALRDLSPQEVIGNSLRGIRYTVTTRRPHPVGGLQPAPHHSLTRISKEIVNKQGGDLPNPFAYFPKTALAILDGYIGVEGEAERPILDRIGRDQAYMQLRMETDLGPLFKTNASGRLDFRRTAAAFAEKDYEREALFGSGEDSILSILCQVLEFDPHRPDRAYRDLDGQVTRWVNPTIQFVNPAELRRSDILPLSGRLSAGSGVDPTGGVAEGSPLRAMLAESARRLKDDPALPERLRALHARMGGMKTGERARFFLETTEGQDYLGWFHDIWRWKRGTMGDLRGAPDQRPEINHTLLRQTPLASRA